MWLLERILRMLSCLFAVNVAIFQQCDGFFSCMSILRRIHGPEWQTWVQQLFAWAWLVIKIHNQACWTHLCPTPKPDTRQVRRATENRGMNSGKFDTTWLGLYGNKKSYVLIPLKFKALFGDFLILSQLQDITVDKLSTGITTERTVTWVWKV